MGGTRLSGSGRPWVPMIWLLEGRLGVPCQAGASQGDRAETLGREVAAYASVGKLGRTSGPSDGTTGWLAMRTLHAMSNSALVRLG